MKNLVVATVRAINNSIDGKVGHNEVTAKTAVKMLHSYCTEKFGYEGSVDIIKTMLISIKQTRNDTKCNQVLLECFSVL